MRLPVRIIQAVTPAAHREFVVGDTLERATEIERVSGKWAASRWLWRETWRVVLRAPQHRFSARSPRASRGATREGMAGGIARNLTNARRQLMRRPALPVVIIAMLAIGIGVTTGIFSLFHQLLIQPLPVPDPNGLVNVAPSPIPVLSYPMFRDLEARQDVLTGLAAFNLIEANLSYGTQLRSGMAMTVSGQYFDLLGLVPALGRLIGPQDEPALAESRVAVLSHGYWQRDLGGDPSVVGRMLTVNGRGLTIIGVAPPGFSGTVLGARPQAFVPLTLEFMLRNLRRGEEGNRFGFSLLAFGRLQPGVEIEQAEAALDALHAAIVADFEAALDPGFPVPERTISLEPGAHGLRDQLDAEIAKPLTMLLGVTIEVLLEV